MRCHLHDSSNMLLGKPPDSTNVDIVPATMMVDDETGQVTIATFWLPTEEELRSLNSGASVVLYVLDNMHPCVAIGVHP